MYSVVGSDGQVYGPVDMATLSQWIAEGRIVPSTNLIDPIDGRVIQAGQAPALMGNFPPTVTAPPPTSHGNPQTFGGVGMGNPYATPQPYQNAYPRPGEYYAGPPKSKVAAALLAFFLGGLGIHRFYLGHTGLGIAYLVLFVVGFLTCGTTWFINGIWALVDLVLILTGGVREANGRELV